MYEVKCVGIDGDVRYFLKPWFMTATPFVGMIWCLPVAMLQDRRKRKRPAAGATEALEPLINGNGAGGNVRPVAARANARLQRNPHTCCACALSLERDDNCVLG